MHVDEALNNFFYEIRNDYNSKKKSKITSIEQSFFPASQGNDTDLEMTANRT